MLSFVMLVVGFALLVWGADKFVEGASALARKMGVSPLLVGLTIVAFGTSMPELAVSVTAALQGANEIAVGNVVGSNVFNLLVVAGLSAVICPLVMDKMLLRRDWPMPAMMIWVNIVLGLACIVIGGQLAVNGATGIARMFGLSETLIGLTIVALGTSLPELVTSIVAARKGQNEIAMGNVIGSNLFNILLILGVSSVITPIPVQATSIIDCLFLIAISVIFYIPARKGKLGRLPGALMVASYVAYTVYLIMR